MLNGCAVDLGFCSAGPAYQTIPDNVDNAAYDTARCLARAKDYVTWCGTPAGRYGASSQSFSNGGLVAATPGVEGSGCEIRLLDCPRAFQVVPPYGVFPWGFDFGEAQPSLAACLQRAQDYYGWCQDGTSGVNLQIYVQYFDPADPYDARTGTRLCSLGSAQLGFPPCVDL
jgi:hypothetical protein